MTEVEAVVGHAPQRVSMRRPSVELYLLIAVLVGILGGAAGVILHVAVEYFSHWPDWLSARLGAGAGTVLLVVIPPTLILAARTLAIHLAPEAAGSGIPEVEAAIEGRSTIRWRRVFPVKLLGGIMALSSGLVGGREGPTVHLGASVAAGLAERFRLTDNDYKGLLAAGAAAGLAAAFNAPLAAILFVIEETRRQFPYAQRTYLAVIVASCLAALLTEGIAGTVPQLLTLADPVPLASLILFLPLGAVLGCLGVIFNTSLLGTLDLVARLGRRGGIAFVIVVGAIIGILMGHFHEATGGGEHLVQELLGAPHGLTFLLAVAVFRFLLTLASYACGAPAGIFAPLLALAAAAGLVFGKIVLLVLPESYVSIPILPAIAVAAMGGTFAAAVRAPLVGAILTLELTGAWDLLVPVLLTCAIAHHVAGRLGGRPIYEALLDRKLKLAGQLPISHPGSGAGLGARSLRSRRRGTKPPPE
ncbi:chloride channel protein, CIC family [Arboricoccus pini]|uniref:Chloride channel protein, CIC family n=1 Tax=Arboricoccus pini TaxID=1963835 RepID=A0A212RD45_9PROT|nr:H(+)/Cl(-) exchange transporter ClcA [Arboricoccus pini]SNB70011.1 chloride channel protein, CIC family [Arboricoccus pini]